MAGCDWPKFGQISPASWENVSGKIGNGIIDVF